MLVFLVCMQTVQAYEFDAKVIAVIDGDTVLVLHEGGKLKVRLANIDAPEIDQPYGKESRQALSELILKKEVHLVQHATDTYGRMIADISLYGQSINQAQVRNGDAWEYSHFHRDKFYVGLQQQAMQARVGLWGLAVAPVSPEQWRKSHPEKYGSHAAISSSRPVVACGHKKHCNQMTSCEEARLYLVQCGMKSLDADNNGVPCELLCNAEAMVKVPAVRVR